MGLLLGAACHANEFDEGRDFHQCTLFNNFFLVLAVRARTLGQRCRQRRRDDVMLFTV